MIGNSLSFCVRDILAGKVVETDVEKIVTSTAIGPTDAEWDAAIARYCETYWRNYDPVTVRALVFRLRDSGKIEQPRLADSENPDLWNKDLVRLGVWS